MAQTKVEIKRTYHRDYCHQPHQVFVDEHSQLREGGVADLMLPMNLKAPENTGIKPCDRLGKEITPYDLERHNVDVGGKL